MRACAIPDCERPAKSRGWCNTHYEQWRKHGDPLYRAPRPEPRPRASCSIEGCEREVYGHGWCNLHYQRWKSHGDPLMTLRPTLGSYRHVAEPGYVYVYRPGHLLALPNGYVAEHRLVAWEAGLLVDLTDDVHHRNEVKDNNRLENLEVRTHGDHAREHDRVGAANRSKTHCPQGHPYDAENTKRVPSRPNSRYCRACHRERNREDKRRARRRAA